MIFAKSNIELIKSVKETPTVVFFIVLGVAIIAGIYLIRAIYLTRKIYLNRRKKKDETEQAGNDDPPSYHGLGSAEVVLGFSIPRSPSYHDSVAGEEPPIYSFDNVAHEHDPPAYDGVESFFETVVTL